MTPATLNLRLACASLQDAWRRNVLALSGLAIGVGAIVAMLALTLIVRREALRQFDRTGLDVLAIRKISGAGLSPARRAPVIDLDVVQQLAAGVPALERLAPVMERRNGVLGYGGNSLQAALLGVSEAFVDLNSLQAAEGRLLADLDRDEPHVVLGRDLAASLRKGDPAPLVGRQVNIEGRLLTIIGVLGPSQAIGLYDGNLNQSVLLHVRAFERVVPGVEIGVIYARHRAGSDAAEVAADVVAELQGRVEGLAVQVTSAAEIMGEMRRQLRLFTLLLGATGSIALVLGGAGILNSLLLAVAERRREIGLRRALGALRADIQAQFLYEAVLLCGTGGLIGSVLGALTTAVIARRAEWDFALPPATLFLGVGVAVIVGSLSGFFPAYQAARLEPVVAMKNDR